MRRSIICIWSGILCVTAVFLLDVIRAADTELFLQPPTIRANPVERAPLVAIVDFETSEPARFVLEIDDGTRQWKQPIPAPSATPQKTQHHLAVMGMRPGLQHTIRVRATTFDGTQSELSRPLTFETPPLPANFPPLKVTLAQPEHMEPGITLFATNLWIDDESMMDYGYIVALDSQGEVVWYCQTEDRIADMRILANGNLLYQHGNYRFAYEIDLLGNDIRSWYGANLTLPPNPASVAVDVDTMHHEIIEQPNGNFITLATELLRFDRFPTSLTDATASWEPAQVVSDAIVEFNPNNGQIVRHIPLVDFVDRERMGYLSLGGFWKDKYDHALQSPSRDWMHANGLVTLPEESAAIVSLRHLDCLIKIDLETKKARWMLGPPDGWEQPWSSLLLKPIGEWPWSYHQHAPQWTSRGTLRIYDNGNYRARPYDAFVPASRNRSRIVEYGIDESAMTVTQLTETRGVFGDEFYCPFYGEADEIQQGIC